MRGRIRVPAFVIASALLGLILVLATLQYRWLGRISEAERDRRTAALNAQATAFAQDFDRELTRAFLLFQEDPLHPGENAAARMSARYERWASTARYPKILGEFYFARAGEGTAATLQRFNAATRFLEPVDWPAPLAGIRAQFEQSRDVTTDLRGAANGTFIRAIAATLWEEVPALVVPTPLMDFEQSPAGHDLRLTARMSYTILMLDRDYIRHELLPALAQQHFTAAGDGADYQLAVVSSTRPDVLFSSAPGFSPRADAKVDAATDLFQVRAQDFSAMASEIRRVSTFVRSVPSGDAPAGTHVAVPRGSAPRVSTFTIREAAPMSIIVQQKGLTAAQRTALESAARERSAAVAGAATAISTRAAAPVPARWRLLIQHRAGSLEAAVHATRRRNLIVSSSILAVLGASVGLLILSTRRAQDLARQQMEFVAAVSHELRTPLAVIRSAGENLADGVVRDDAQIRRYGDLVRNEGRRLTEMVEQILEFAGIQSGQRGFALRPVAILPLLHDVVDAFGALIEQAGIEVEYDVPASLPPVLGDEPALRRAFQNLVGNAVKYGAGGGWIRLRASGGSREVRISVEDRGIGIAAAEHAQIFEPFYRAPEVIAAQIQGAGLGLSLVKRIVEAHGGRISVRSEPGKGTEFTVHLPAASEEPVSRRADVQPETLRSQLRT